MKQNIDQIFEMAADSRRKRTAVSDNELSHFMESAVSRAVVGSSNRKKWRIGIAAAAACSLIIGFATIFLLQDSNVTTDAKRDSMIAATDKDRNYVADDNVTTARTTKTAITAYAYNEENNIAKHRSSAHKSKESDHTNSADPIESASENKAKIISEVELIAEIKAIGVEIPEIQFAEATGGMNEMMDLLAESLSVFEYLPIETIFGDISQNESN